MKLDKILEALPTEELVDLAISKGWDRYTHQVEMSVNIVIDSKFKTKRIKYLPKVTLNLIHEWVMQKFGYYIYCWCNIGNNNTFSGSYSVANGVIGEVVTDNNSTYNEALINSLIYILKTKI
jgi:hypothetical protein